MGLLYDKEVISIMLKIAVCDDEKYCGEKIVSLLEESLDKYGISVY